MALLVAYLVSREFTTSEYEKGAPTSYLFDEARSKESLYMIDAAELQLKGWNSHVAAPSDTPLLLQNASNADRKVRMGFGAAGSNV